MPGTPYLDQPPKGLLTWPRLLKLTIPTLSVLTIVAWWQGLLIYWSIFLILILAITSFRK
jgi:hypothetical protein